MRFRAVVPAALAFFIAACTTTTRPGVSGVEREQFMLISASEAEQIGTLTFFAQNEKAEAEGRLITEGDDWMRLNKIAHRLTQKTRIFRHDAVRWKWRVALIDSPELNATCRPGGKITFYTGIIKRLNLSDDEIAAVMGHEIAHALREHTRERLSRDRAQKLITMAVAGSGKLKEDDIKQANELARYLVALPHSREAETEADKIGLELAARAGYDPRAAIRFWQKMARATRGNNPPEFESTHPSHATRIAELTALLPEVLPLYEVFSKTK